MNDFPRKPEEAYVEPAELAERVDRVGFGVAGTSTIMFFLGFVFAYFYLRSLNNNGLWQPPGVSPPTAYGIGITAALVLSAVAFAYVAWAARRGRPWIFFAALALLLAFGACVAQCIEYAHLSFGPRSGGFASVFYGWTTLYTVVVLISLYRIETLLASGLRFRHTETTEPPPDIMPGAYYWGLLTSIGVLAWILLYLV